MFFSCSKSIKRGNLLEIFVNIDQETPLSLSEITEELTAIDLELTAKSLINIDKIKRIITFENIIIITEINKILIFGKDGKFIRSIGSKGQGPGEYNFIMNLTVDDKNKHIFISSSSPGKIICYDLTGKFIKEIVTNSIFDNVVDINFINNDLLIIDQKMDGHNEMGKFTSISTLYRLNDNFAVIDSFLIRKTYDNSILGFNYTDFILKRNETVYLYCHEFYPKELAPREIILRDTLYCYKENRLVPELKLKFKNDGIDNAGNKFIDPYNIYRSSRYVFSFYENYLNETKYYFCYDINNGKQYNIRKGYSDNINGIDKPITIRPFNNDTETFYYLYTHMKPGDLEEPNPTLYIGKLKK